MRRSRFNDEQIIGILKEHRRDYRLGALPEITGSAMRRFTKWGSKVGGMEVPEAKRPQALEEENGKLKLLLADAMLT